MYSEKHDEEKPEAQSLYRALAAYAESDFYPFHMPGHKRNPASGEMAEYYKIDITEIDGFDNLHQAQGILRDAQLRANRLYGAEETFFLVNGSTCGILAAVMAVTEPGDELLIARNCHKSVYHAAILQELRLSYYQPGMIREYDICDGVSAEELARLLDAHPQAKAVVITSPTYEGIISDVKKIAAVVHERGKILIVDEAHGAHLNYCLGMRGAVSYGADLVIHSLHKTLPAMTQTALLHVNGSRVDRGRLRRYLAILQSSSPSYVLMASMDSCVRFLEEQGERLTALFSIQYRKFMERTARCRHIRVGKMTDLSENNYHAVGWDIGKMVISVKDTILSGPRLYDILREEYCLQMEMASETFVLAMMTLMDTEEGWQRLAVALCEIDDRIERESCGQTKPKKSKEKKEEKESAVNSFQKHPKVVMTPAQAFCGSREEVPFDEAAGRISADFINLYPPGIPFVAPGELIDETAVRRMMENRRMGLRLQGVSEEGRVAVVARNR